MDRDEQVIDTHTIDIVLEYIDEPIYEEPTDTQQINLSDEDKLRVAKLTSLIENAPEHQQYELNQFIELLLDEWYDDAARADTLFRMHQYIGANPDLDPNLAAEIQSQIDAIYAEWQDDLDERALARKLISDFIPRTNPDYSSIFGDTNTGEPGWIHQFSDDPVHLQDNINFAERIWKAVSFDASIEDAKRQIIYDQLGVLVGTPLDQIEGENIPEEDDGWKSVLLSVLLWLLYIVWGIIVIGAIVFLVRFLMSRRDDSDSVT